MAKKKKPQSWLRWIVVGPDGSAFGSVVCWTRKLACWGFLRHQRPGRQNMKRWRKLYRRGWRCIKVQITEVTQ